MYASAHCCQFAEITYFRAAPRAASPISCRASRSRASSRSRLPQSPGRQRYPVTPSCTTPRYGSASLASTGMPRDIASTTFIEDLHLLKALSASGARAMSKSYPPNQARQSTLTATGWVCRTGSRSGSSSR